MSAEKNIARQILAKKEGLYDKLLDHCEFILNKNTNEIYPWRFISRAYIGKEQVIYAKTAKNIYHLIEKVRNKRHKKILRRLRISQFLWCHFFCHFSPKYHKIIKISRKEKKRNHKLLK